MAWHASCLFCHVNIRCRISIDGPMDSVAAMLAEVETGDKMTHNQVAAKVRAFFIFNIFRIY